MYGAIAISRCLLHADLKQYLDLKGGFDLDGFCRSVEEWKRTHPGKQVWDIKNKTVNETPAHRGSQNSIRKAGACYYCGKPGHFAQHCRTRMFKERMSATPSNSQPNPVAKKEVTNKHKQSRPLTDIICFNCQQKGHISPDCPKKLNRIKRVKIPEDRIVSLRRNEIFGAVGPHRMPITCDTGANITVVPDECVEPHQRTGEVCELKSFNNCKSTGEWCQVEITAGDVTFSKKAVTQPGDSLGLSVCLSLDNSTY